MKSLELFFMDLLQFKENEMTDELNNLNELRRKYLKNYSDINEEEKNSENYIEDNSNKKRKKFILKEEEDIDEGNDNYNNIIITNKSSLNKSYKNKEQRLIFANNEIYNREISKDILIEREKDALVKKLFNMNLVKKKL